jgi:hypothetical protein
VTSALDGLLSYGKSTDNVPSPTKSDIVALAIEVHLIMHNYPAHKVQRCSSGSIVLAVINAYPPTMCLMGS